MDSFIAPLLHNNRRPTKCFEPIKKKMYLQDIMVVKARIIRSERSGMEDKTSNLDPFPNILRAGGVAPAALINA
jgi:hypothetical protein